MIIRKAFYWWLFPSAVVLPVWLLIGWATFSRGSGWSLLGLLILCPILFLAQMAVSGIIVGRRSAREVRAVSWPDVALLTGWHASVIAFGFFPAQASGWLAVLAIAFFLGTFWLVLGELVGDTRVRVQETSAAYEQAAQPQQVHRPEPPLDSVEYIVVEERHDER